MILKKTTHSLAVSSECGHYERSMLRMLMNTLRAGAITGGERHAFKRSSFKACGRNAEFCFKAP